MLDLNQRPPPCKFGQSFPGRYCPVGKSRLSKRFLTFLAPSFSCSVRLRSASVATWLQQLTLLRTTPFPPTLSRSGSAMLDMVLLTRAPACLAAGTLLHLLEIVYGQEPLEELRP